MMMMMKNSLNLYNNDNVYDLGEERKKKQLTCAIKVLIGVPIGFRFSPNCVVKLNEHDL